MTSPTEDPKVPETGWQVIEHPLWTSEEPGARTRLFDLIEAERGHEVAVAAWMQAWSLEDAIADSHRALLEGLADGPEESGPAHGGRFS